MELFKLWGTIEINRREAQAALKDVEAEAQKTGQRMAKDMQKHGEEMGEKLGEGIKKGVRLAIGALTALTSAAAALGLKMNASLEQARVGFETMLGSAERADRFLRDLAQFAARTPFEFQGLVQTSQRLLAMGFAAEEVIPMLTAVGNAAAALGSGQEGINRIVTALGQMQAKAKVSSEEMMQLTEAGIPAWEILAQKIGVSIPEAMKKAQDGAIDAGTAIEAFVSGMNERFGGMMEKQSRNFLGLLSTIKDSVTMALGRVTAGAFDNIQAKLERLADYVQSAEFDKRVDAIAAAISQKLVPAIDTTIGLLRTLWQVVSPLVQFLTERPELVLGVLAGVLTAKLIPAITALVAGVQKLGSALKALTAGNWVGLVLTTLPLAIGGLVTLIGRLQRAHEEESRQAELAANKERNVALALADQAKAHADSATAANEQATELSGLIQEYEALTSATSLNADQRERLQQVMARILELQPQLKSGYSDEKTAIDSNIQSLKAYIVQLASASKASLEMAKAEARASIIGLSAEEQRLKKELEARRTRMSVINQAVAQAELKLAAVQSMQPQLTWSDFDRAAKDLAPVLKAAQSLVDVSTSLGQSGGAAQTLVNVLKAALAPGANVEQRLQAYQLIPGLLKQAQDQLNSLKEYAKSEGAATDALQAQYDSIYGRLQATLQLSKALDEGLAGISSVTRELAQANEEAAQGQKQVAQAANETTDAFEKALDTYKQLLSVNAQQVDSYEKQIAYLQKSVLPLADTWEKQKQVYDLIWEAANKNFEQQAAKANWSAEEQLAAYQRLVAGHARSFDQIQEREAKLADLRARIADEAYSAAMDAYDRETRGLELTVEERKAIFQREVVDRLAGVKLSADAQKAIELQLLDFERELGSERTQQAQEQEAIIEKLQLERLERTGDAEAVDLAKEEQRYQEELKLAKGNDQLLEEVERSHQERVNQIRTEALLDWTEKYLEANDVELSAQIAALETVRKLAQERGVILEGLDDKIAKLQKDQAEREANAAEESIRQAQQEWRDRIDLEWAGTEKQKQIIRDYVAWLRQTLKQPGLSTGLQAALSRDLQSLTAEAEGWDAEALVKRLMPGENVKDVLRLSIVRDQLRQAQQMALDEGERGAKAASVYADAVDELTQRIDQLTEAEQKRVETERQVQINQLLAKTETGALSERLAAYNDLIKVYQGEVESLEKAGKKGTDEWYSALKNLREAAKSQADLFISDLLDPKKFEKAQSEGQGAAYIAGLSGKLAAFGKTVQDAFTVHPDWFGPAMEVVNQGWQKLSELSAQGAADAAAETERVLKLNVTMGLAGALDKYREWLTQMLSQTQVGSQEWQHYWEEMRSVASQEAQDTISKLGDFSRMTLDQLKSAAEQLGAYSIDLAKKYNLAGMDAIDQVDQAMSEILQQIASRTENLTEDDVNQAQAILAVIRQNAEIRFGTESQVVRLIDDLNTGLTQRLIQLAQERADADAQAAAEREKHEREVARELASLRGDSEAEYKLDLEQRIAELREAGWTEVEIIRWAVEHGNQVRREAAEANYELMRQLGQVELKAQLEHEAEKVNKTIWSETERARAASDYYSYVTGLISDASRDELQAIRDTLAAQLAKYEAMGEAGKQMVAAIKAALKEVDEALERPFKEFAQDLKQRWGKMLLGPFWDLGTRVADVWRSQEVTAGLKKAVNELLQTSTGQLLTGVYGRAADWLKKKAAPWIESVKDVARIFATWMPVVVGDALAALQRRFVSWAAGIAGIFGRAIDAGALNQKLTGFLNQAFTHLGALTNWFMTTIAQTLAGPLGEIITSLAEASPQLKQLLDAITPVFEALASAIGQLFTPLIPVVQRLSKILEPLISALGEYFAVFGELLASILDALLPVINLLVRIITPMIKGIVWVFDHIIIPVWNGIVRILRDLWNVTAKIVNFIIDAINWLYPFGDLIKWKMPTWEESQPDQSDQTNQKDTSTGTAGKQISEITGPTRDLLITLLSPLASLDSLVGIGGRIYDAVADIRNLIAGTPVPQLAAAGTGGVNVTIEQITIQAERATAESISKRLVETLEEQLSDLMTTRLRGRGL